MASSDRLTMERIYEVVIVASSKDCAGNCLKRPRETIKILLHIILSMNRDFEPETLQMRSRFSNHSTAAFGIVIPGNGYK
jgi:hypothetical protein